MQKVRNQIFAVITSLLMLIAYCISPMSVMAADIGNNFTLNYTENDGIVNVEFTIGEISNVSSFVAVLKYDNEKYSITNSTPVDNSVIINDMPDKGKVVIPVGSMLNVAGNTKFFDIEFKTNGNASVKDFEFELTDLYNQDIEEVGFSLDIKWNNEDVIEEEPPQQTETITSIVTTTATSTENTNKVTTSVTTTEVLSTTTSVTTSVQNSNDDNIFYYFYELNKETNKVELVFGVKGKVMFASLDGSFKIKSTGLSEPKLKSCDSGVVAYYIEKTNEILYAYTSTSNLTKSQELFRYSFDVADTEYSLDLIPEITNLSSTTEYLDNYRIVNEGAEYTPSETDKTTENSTTLTTISTTTTKPTTTTTTTTKPTTTTTTTTKPTTTTTTTTKPTTTTTTTTKPTTTTTTTTKPTTTTTTTTKPTTTTTTTTKPTTTTTTTIVIVNINKIESNGTSVVGALLILNGLDEDGDSITFDKGDIIIEDDINLVNGVGENIVWFSGSSSINVKLINGIYTLKEENAPDGYLLSDDIVFEVRNGKITINGKEVESINMIDELIPITTTTTTTTTTSTTTSTTTTTTTTTSTTTSTTTTTTTSTTTSTATTTTTTSTTTSTTTTTTTSTTTSTTTTTTTTSTTTSTTTTTTTSTTTSATTTTTTSTTTSTTTTTTTTSTTTTTTTSTTTSTTTTTTTTSTTTSKTTTITTTSTTTSTTTTTTTTTTSTTTTVTSTTTFMTTTTPPTTTEPAYLLGDVNEDGSVDSSDASLVLAEYAKIQTGGAGEFTDVQYKAADVNKDDTVDSSDASRILAYYAMVSTGKKPTWD